MIKFYSPKADYGPFSNFSRHEVRIYDRLWRTSEAAFQAIKFHPHRPDLVDLVWACETPGKAAIAGRDHSKPLRPDWDSHPSLEMMIGVHGIKQPDDGVNRMGVTAEPLFVRVKDVLMYEIVLAKFSQHEDLKAMLLGTGDQVIIEDADSDPYWGWGCSFVGQNKLGRILMAVRSKLK